jgi:gliding motility-associated-like protein
VCPNSPITIGTTPNPLYNYYWIGSSGLSSPNVANPVLTVPSYFPAGTYPYVVSTSLASNPGNCNTFDTINVTVVPYYNDTVDQVVCNASSYSFNGQILTQPGTYVDTLTAIQGCDSIVTLNLTFVNSQANAGPDIFICSNEVGNLGQSPIAGYNYSWSPATNLSASNVSNPSVTANNVSGTPIVQNYTLTTTSIANPGLCPATDQVQVTIYPKYITNITDTLCNGGPYLFNGQSISQTGIYVDSLTSINGCDSIFNLNIVISSDPQFTVNDTSICIGNSLTLAPQNSQGTYAYTWTPQMSVPSSNGAMTWNPTNSNEFFLLATNNVGCTHLDSLNLTVNPLPLMGLQASASALCPDETLTLTASGAASYSWSGPGVIPTAGNSQSIFPTGSGVFQVIGYTNAGCADSIQSNFLLYPSPVLTATPDQEICLGDMAAISVSGADTYDWTPATLSGTQAFVYPTLTTAYQIIGFNQFNCTDTVLSTVVVHPNPVAQIGAEPSLLTSDSPEVTFSNLSTGQQISTWNFGDGVITQDPSSSIEYQYPFEEGDYNVELLVISEFGCRDSISQLIQVKGDVLYYVPNAFTPDGDEHNNQFMPVFTSGFVPGSYQFDVFNRWGELVFTSQNPQIGWDGYLNFVKCQEGIYTYVIRFKLTTTDEIRTISGHLNLMK